MTRDHSYIVTVLPHGTPTPPLARHEAIALVMAHTGQEADVAELLIATVQQLGPRVVVRGVDGRPDVRVVLPAHPQRG